ncbi:MAG: sigma-70 family RNA polymerase sigma factor [Microgenomates group bacterium]
MSAEKKDKVLELADSGELVDLHLKEIGSHSLLTAEEEVILAKQIESGQLAREELAQDKADSQRQEELQQRIEEGWTAREHLITHNGRLVVSVAKRYMGRGVPFLDLIQEGQTGLMRATEKFDYRRGHRFSTYATWWIRQAISRVIANQSRTIRLPVHMHDRINKMNRAKHGLIQELERDPTPQEIAEVLDLPVKKVEKLIQIARVPLSLHSPIGDDGSEFGDFIEDEFATIPSAEVLPILQKKDLEEVLSQLTPREARILRLRNGMVDGQPHTLQMVADKMGVTRERIRQIEKQALARLRSFREIQPLRDYIRK